MAKEINTEFSNPLEKCFHRITRYHCYVFFILFLCKVPLCWHILNLIFLSPPMEFTCDGVKNKCPCENPVWNRSIFAETMQTKFELHCENSWLTHFAHSTTNVGILLGSLSFGFLSDIFGRRIIACMSFFFVSVAGILISFMPNIYSFTIMRFLEGFGIGGGIVTTYVWCIEFCSAKHREVVTALFHIPLNIGHMTLPGLSYLLRNMDHFQLAISIPTLFFVSMYWLIMESPKWLMDNDHIDILIKGLTRICPQNCANMQEEMETFKKSRNQSSNEKIKFWHIFKHKRLSLNFGCMAVNYFVCGMGYYGVSHFIGTMDGNIHLNVAISGLLVLPGTILCIFLLPLFSRRNFLIVTNFLAGIFIIAVVATPTDYDWLRVAFACVSNCFFFMSFIIIFLYGVELFPTSVRNSVLGILSVLSRIGQILEPPINSMSLTAAGAIFGVMAIIGALMCIPLPDTKNTVLPSTLADTKMINQKWPSQQLTGSNTKPSTSMKPNQ